MKTTEQLYMKAAALCAKKEYAISDIRKKTMDWEGTNEQANEVIERLIDERFIDESRFCRLYAKEKFRFNKWGKQRIRMELSRKLIDKKHIENAISTLSEEEYSEQLVQLLRQKQRSVKGVTEFEIQTKLFRFALGRGFESRAITNALKQMYDDVIESD